MLQYINRKKVKKGQVFEKSLGQFMTGKYTSLRSSKMSFAHDFSKKDLSVDQATARDTNPVAVHIDSFDNVVTTCVLDATINALSSTYKAV